MELNSGLWVGNARIARDWSWSIYFLVCWKINRCPSLTSWNSFFFLKDLHYVFVFFSFIHLSDTDKQRWHQPGAKEFLLLTWRGLSWYQRSPTQECLLNLSTFKNNNSTVQILFTSLFYSVHTSTVKAEAGVRASRATTFIFRKAATTITFLTLSQRLRDNIRIILPVIRRKRAGLHHPNVPRLLPNGLQPGLQ